MEVKYWIKFPNEAPFLVRERDWFGFMNTFSNLVQKFNKKPEWIIEG